MYLIETQSPVARMWFLPGADALLVRSRPDADRPAEVSVWSWNGRDPIRLEAPVDPDSGRALAFSNWTPALIPGRPLCLYPCEDRLHLFDLDSGRPRPTEHRPVALDVALSRDGRRLVTRRQDAYARSALSGWTIEEGGPHPSWDWEPPESVAIATLVGAFGTEDELALLGRGMLRVFSAADRALVAEALLPPRRAVYGAEVSSDQRTLVVQFADTILIFDRSDLEHPRSIGPAANIDLESGFALRPDGRRLALIHGDLSVVGLWDLDNLEPYATLDWGIGPLKRVVFSPDGALGAVADDAGRIAVWDFD